VVRSRFSMEEAECGLEMEGDGFGEGGEVDFADSLLDLLTAAEFDEGAAACFFG
jgi:hypothetical protein